MTAALYQFATSHQLLIPSHFSAMAMVLRSRPNPNPADDPEAEDDEKKKEQSVPLRQILLRKVKLCSWKKLLALLLFAITLLRIAWNMDQVAKIARSAEVWATLALLVFKQKEGLPFSVPVLIASGVLGPLIGAAAFVPFFWRFDRKSELHWMSLIGCLAANFFSVLSSGLLGPTLFVVTGLPGRLCLVVIRSIRLKDLGWRLTSEAYFFVGWLHVTRVQLPPGVVWTSLDFASLVVVALGPATIFFLKANAMQRAAKERDTKEHASAHNELESQTWREIYYLHLGAGLTVMDALCLPILHLLTAERTVLEAFLGRGVLLGHNGAAAPFWVVDDAWVLFSILILGGVIGPQGVLKLNHAPTQQMTYTARAKGKRVNFDIFAANKRLKMLLKMLLALLLFVITVLRMVQRPHVKLYLWPYGSHLPMEDMEVLHVIFGLLRPLIGAAAFVPFFWRFDRKSLLHGMSLFGCFIINLVNVKLENNMDVPKREFLEFVIMYRWVIRLFLVEITSLKLRSLGWQDAGFGYKSASFCWMVLHFILRISGIRSGLLHALG